MVNLTCGRNPWKRACQADSTYRAYSRNPRFLRSILPISQELEAILNRVFEIDPRKRIGLAELRDLVSNCPSFTNRSVPTGLLTPLPEKAQVPVVIHNPPPSSPVSHPVSSNSSASSGSSGPSFSDSVSERSTNSSRSSISSQSSYEPIPKPQEAPLPFHTTTQQPVFFPSVPQGDFFGPWSSYQCRPLLQPHQHHFNYQAPLVC